MIEVNNQSLSRQGLYEAAQPFICQPAFSECEKQSYALCLKDTAEYLALLLFLKRRGAGVMPIHADTPEIAARKLAIKGGCSRLVYQCADNIIELEQQETVHAGHLIQMSSGTTGEPKAIRRSWSSIDTEVKSYVSFFSKPDEMTAVIACPVTHSYGLIAGLLVALQRGQTPVIVDGINPKYLLNKLHQVNQPLLYSSPAMLNVLASLLGKAQQLHAVMTSGTLLPGPWFNHIRSKVTHFFQQYGCSEAGCIAINPNLQAADEIGYLLPHHRLVSALDRTPKELVIQTGDLQVRTGDLISRQGDGMLRFVARLDDTINVAGINVYPKDVEEVVLTKPQITDAVALRMADPLAGERVRLVFSADEKQDENALRFWCQAHLAAYQQPAEWVQVEDIPRQANGKISRRHVAESLARGTLSLFAGRANG